MGVRVGKWESGVLGARLWARASSAHRTALDLCLEVIDLDSSAAVEYPPFSAPACSAPMRETKHWGLKQLLFVSAVGNYQRRGKFWILCFSLTYFCFTHFLVFPTTVIKIHLSDQLQPNSSNREPFSCQSPSTKKLLQPYQNMWKKRNHLVLTSSPCSQWGDYRAFSSWQGIHPFFSQNHWGTWRLSTKK